MSWSVLKVALACIAAFASLYWLNEASKRPSPQQQAQDCLDRGGVPILLETRPARLLCFSEDAFK